MQVGMEEELGLEGNRINIDVIYNVLLSFSILEEYTVSSQHKRSPQTDSSERGCLVFSPT